MEDEENFDEIAFRAIVSNVARWVSLSARGAGSASAAMTAASSRTKREGEDEPGAKVTGRARPE